MLASDRKLTRAAAFLWPPLQDFYADGADAVVEDLAGVTIDSLFNAIYKNGAVEDIKEKAAQPSDPSTGHL